MVQEELMRQGHFKAATHYVRYRDERARMRKEEEDKRRIPNQELMVTVLSNDGRASFWDGTDLRSASPTPPSASTSTSPKVEIERELRRSVGKEISEKDLKNTIILNAKALIEKDADFAKFAGRILLSYIYEEVLDWSIMRDGIEKLKEAHHKAPSRATSSTASPSSASPRAARHYDLDKLADAFDPSADLDFDYLGIQTMYDRYLIVDKTRQQARRIETPAVLLDARLHGPLQARGKGPRALGHPPLQSLQGPPLLLLHAHPLQLRHPAQPALLLLPLQGGRLHREHHDPRHRRKCLPLQMGRRTRRLVDRVRGTGGYIQGTNGECQGIIPFLKLHNDQLVAVNQGGKRRGSGCAYLETWHNDIEDFLELRKNTGDERRRMPRHEHRQLDSRPVHEAHGGARDLDPLPLERGPRPPRPLRASSSSATASTSGSPRRARSGRAIPAIELWKTMLKMVFETGHPWITFKDPCNVRSPQDHVGVIHSSNLCTEITLNTSEEETAVCNLGSVILDTHITRDGALDHEMLRETITVAVRALDNVIDINFYPTEAARLQTRHRPIGLGVMGLQNALYKRNLAFASDAAVEFNDEFMEAIAYYAYSASSDLAAEVGTYSSYQGSKWDRGLLPQDTVDLLEEERGRKIDVPRGGKMDWSASAKRSPSTACGTPTSSPSRRPPPSRTSWAPPPASSRTTRTST